MKKITFILLVMLSLSGLAQEYTYIDFGSPNAGFTTSGNWNNIASSINNNASITASLINATGSSTGVTLTVDDPFDTNNTAGTTSPDSSLPFPSTATRDSFFGETVSFNGNLQPTGGFTLSGLDPTKYYSFSIFASRTGVTDNRESQYTLVGNTTQIVALNASNNTSNTVNVNNLQPTATGTITFTAAPGSNNNNASGFYYLGAIEMITSTTALNSEIFQLKNILSLYPNPINDFFEVKFNLEKGADVQIDLYDINGKLIQNLYNNSHPAGLFNLKWEKGLNNATLTTGMYFLKVNVNGDLHTEKLILK